VAKAAGGPTKGAEEGLSPLEEESYTAEQ
jgi:hypothetical protein